MVINIFSSFCNSSYEAVAGKEMKIVQSFLPQLFQPHLLCAGYQVVKLFGEG